MTLFELVMALAKKILKCTEQEAIDIAESRLARMSSELSEYDKVAEDPELEDLIDPNDRAEWLKHIEKRTAQRSERKEFRSAVQKNSPASTPLPAPAVRPMHGDPFLKARSSIHKSLHSSSVRRSLAYTAMTELGGSKCGGGAKLSNTGTAKAGFGARTECGVPCCTCCASCGQWRTCMGRTNVLGTSSDARTAALLCRDFFVLPGGMELCCSTRDAQTLLFFTAEIRDGRSPVTYSFTWSRQGIVEELPCAFTRASGCEGSHEACSRRVACGSIGVDCGDFMTTCARSTRTMRLLFHEEREIRLLAEPCECFRDV